MAEKLCQLKKAMSYDISFEPVQNGYNSVGAGQNLSWEKSLTIGHKGILVIHMYANIEGGGTDSSTTRSVKKNNTSISKTGGLAYSAVLSEYWDIEVDAGDAIEVSLTVGNTSARQRGGTLFIQLIYAE